MYTRNGSFRFDDEGFLVSQTGNRVQGFNADDDGTMNSLVEDIQIFPGRLLQPGATDSVEIRGNFRPDDPLVGPFDVNDPEGTSTFRTSILTYDAMGNGHELTVFGTRSANNEWELNAVVDGADIDGGVPGQKQVFHSVRSSSPRTDVCRKSSWQLRSIFLGMVRIPVPSILILVNRSLKGAPVLKGPLNGMKLRRAW